MAKAQTEVVAAGTWVEIHRIVLAPGERAPQCPPDTRHVPLEMRVKGFLSALATVGDEVEIVTATGRHLQGTLLQVNPGYTHTFGPLIPELMSIGSEVRDILHQRGRGR